ncbi:hypothetical protein COD78_30165 [Bacillus cereus]|nr:hypothetical protein CN454_25895 [Bacillus cereus]PGV17788.1 hypothetical protein COD78_30165 [Bacillus cereus]
MFLQSRTVLVVAYACALLNRERLARHYIFLLERKKGHTCTVGMVRKVCPSRKICFIYIVVKTNIMVFLLKCKSNFKIISWL